MMKLKKARHEFRVWVRPLKASQARNVAPYAEDVPHVERIEVESSEVVRVFVEKHPEHAEYQEELIQKVGETQREFSLNKQEWLKERAGTKQDGSAEG